MGRSGEQEQGSAVEGSAVEWMVEQLGHALQRIRRRVSDRMLGVLVVVVCVLAVLIWSGLRGMDVNADADPVTPPMFEQVDPTTTSSTVTMLVVHVAGAVRLPGLYRLAQGSRVADAIDSAGGVTGEIDIDRVNLAAPVSDGARIYIARLGVPSPEVEAPPGDATSQGEAAGPIDLNLASQQQLEALPGVGPSTASAILERRGQIGRFMRVEDLLEVRGIGDSKLAQLRSHVIVR